jgi:hypothetical protein
MKLPIRKELKKGKREEGKEGGWVRETLAHILLTYNYPLHPLQQTFVVTF